MDTGTPDTSAHDGQVDFEFVSLVESSRRLDASLARFSFPSKLPHDIVLLSVPKAGTVLLRNILAHFVGPTLTHWQFLYLHNCLHEFEIGHAEVPPKRFYTGHLAFDYGAAEIVRPCRSVLLIRDPRAQVLSQAKFFYNPEAVDFARFRADRVPFAEAVVHAILGRWDEEIQLYGTAETYRRFALAWMGLVTIVVRYEELAAHLKSIDSPEAEVYFTHLLRALGIEPLSDWRRRIVAAADRSISATSTRTRHGGPPQTLTAEQLALLNASAPGLMEILGYGGSGT